MRVIGLDLSLTSTGIGVWRGDAFVDTVRIKPLAHLRGLERMRWLRAEIGSWALSGLWTADLAVIEGPSYGNQGTGRQAGHHERAGLWWLIVDSLEARGVPVAVAPPATVKKYATGKGNAGKDEMLAAAIRRNPEFHGGNDEADAMWLAAMGADHLGHPLMQVPEAHRAALKSVAWPVLIGATT